MRAYKGKHGDRMTFNRILTGDRIRESSIIDSYTDAELDIVRSVHVYDIDGGGEVAIVQHMSGDYWTCAGRDEFLSAKLADCEQWLADNLPNII